MWLWIGSGLVALGVVVLVGLVNHRRHRVRVYRQLADARATLVSGQSIEIACAGSPAEFADCFRRFPIVRLPRFLASDSLEQLLLEARNNVSRMVPSYIPTHKKGRTLSYENIHRHAPACLAFYHSSAVIDWVSAIVGQAVFPTPEQDQSSLSVLYYKDVGDHINWHYDHNFYRGRHFTVLLSLVNRKLDDSGPSSSQLWYRDAHGVEHAVETTQNTLVIFEGQRVRHKASPLKEQEERMMLSMTFCTDPRNSWWKEAARRVKDTAFYGFRALWD